MFFFYLRVTIVREKETRKSKGIAFVLFSKREDALKAIEGVNETEVCWNILIEFLKSNLLNLVRRTNSKM
jgi:RNA recognition motif-containing protein